MAKPRLWVPLLAAFLVTLKNGVNCTDGGLLLNAISKRQNVANAVVDYIGQLSSLDSQQDESLLRVLKSRNDEAQVQRTGPRQHFHRQLMGAEEIDLRTGLKKVAKKAPSKPSPKLLARPPPKGKSKKPPKKVKGVKGKNHRHKKGTKRGKKGRGHKKGKSKKLKGKKRHNQEGKNVLDYDTDEESKSVEYSDESDSSSSTDENSDSSDYDPPSDESDSSYSSSSSSDSISSDSSSSSSSSSGDYTDEEVVGEKGTDDEGGNEKRNYQRSRSTCGYLGCGKPSSWQQAPERAWQGVKSGMSGWAIASTNPKQRAARIGRGKSYSDRIFGSSLF